MNLRYSRIGVIGQACLDEIIGPDGTLRGSSPGGILYSYAALERIIEAQGSETIVIPFGHRSDQDRGKLDEIFVQLKHFDLSHLHPSEELTNRVQLIYHTESHRTEHCPTVLPPLDLTAADRASLEALDVLFVNLISGYDLSLSTMQEIAEITSRHQVHTHLDFHALLLGELSLGGAGEYGSSRKLTGVPQWRTWLSAVHSAQLNESEATALAQPEIKDETSLVESIASEVAEQKLGEFKYLIITRAERGATLYDVRNRTRQDVATTAVHAIDTTGCGDVFGALFSYCIATGCTVIDAVIEANRWAAWNTQIHGLLPMFGASPPSER